MSGAAPAGAAPVRAHGSPPLHAVLRSCPEDFRVTEELGYAADGAGEHVLLEVRKRGLTTPQAAARLARHAGVPERAIGFAGLKDRHAVTVQHFSVGLAGRTEPDWSALAGDDLEVLAHARHRRKLRRGALRGNAFVLVLRRVRGDRTAADARLESLCARGVPNYFGAQRFGRRGDNVAQAQRMFSGARVPRALRGILLSAARAQIFNAVLAERVRAGTWEHGIEGEIWALAGSRSWFGPEPWSAALAARLARGDIHPSGPLWGAGEPPSSAAAGALEREVGARFPALLAGLAAAGLGQDRRALRLPLRDLAWSWHGEDVLELRFALPAGAYATAVVAELAQPGEVAGEDPA